VTVVYSKETTTAKLYLNGILLAANSAMTNITTGGLSRFGIEQTSIPYYFKGSINDINIYDYALTPEQVSANFNAQRNKYGI